MNSLTLNRIDRINVALGAMAAALAGFFWGPLAGLSAAAGALLAVLDFRVVRWMALSAGRRTLEGQRPSMGAVGAVLILKLPALAALVWLAVRALGLSTIPFAMGISALVVSTLFVGLTSASTLDDDDTVSAHG